MTLEQLFKLVRILENKAEDMYKDENGYNFVVTTPKVLYTVDVVMDRGEYMNVGVDAYATDNDDGWDHRLMWLQWDLNRYNEVLTYALNELGNKILKALTERL